MLRELYEYLPLNNREAPPVKHTEDPANRADESLRYVSTYAWLCGGGTYVMQPDIYSSFFVRSPFLIQ